MLPEHDHQQVVEGRGRPRRGELPATASRRWAWRKNRLDALALRPIWSAELERGGLQFRSALRTTLLQQGLAAQYASMRSAASQYWRATAAQGGTVYDTDQGRGVETTVPGKLTCERAAEPTRRRI